MDSFGNKKIYINFYFHHENKNLIIYFLLMQNFIGLYELLMPC